MIKRQKRNGERERFWETALARWRKREFRKIEKEVEKVREREIWKEQRSRREDTLKGSYRPPSRTRTCWALCRAAAVRTGCRSGPGWGTSVGGPSAAAEARWALRCSSGWCLEAKTQRDMVTDSAGPSGHTHQRHIRHTQNSFRDARGRTAEDMQTHQGSPNTVFTGEQMTTDGWRVCPERPPLNDHRVLSLQGHFLSSKQQTYKKTVSIRKSQGDASQDNSTKLFLYQESGEH